MLNTSKFRARTAQAAALLVTLALLGSCAGSGITAYHDYNPALDFSKYRSFAFMSANPMIIASATSPANPLLEPRIMQAIRADLTGKGLREVPEPEQADVVISFTVGSREQIRVDQYPASYRTGYSRYYGRGFYGAGYGTETRVRQYTQGQLAVDIFDVRSKSPAFHGTASKRITSSDRDNPLPVINEIVFEALDGFPPGSGSGIVQPTLVPYQEPAAGAR